MPSCIMLSMSEYSANFFVQLLVRSSLRSVWTPPYLLCRGIGWCASFCSCHCLLSTRLHPHHPASHTFTSTTLTPPHPHTCTHVHCQMGYAMPQQTAHGIHFRQWSRAFIIADSQNKTRVVFVNADICMGSQVIKMQVSFKSILLVSLKGDCSSEDLKPSLVPRPSHPSVCHLQY